MTPATPPEFLKTAIQQTGMSTPITPSLSVADSSKSVVFTTGALLSIMLFGGVPVEDYPFTYIRRLSCVGSSSSATSSATATASGYTVVWPDTVSATAKLADYPQGFLDMIARMLCENPNDRPWLSHCVSALNGMASVDDIVEMRLRDSITTLEGMSAQDKAAIAELSAQLRDRSFELDDVKSKLAQVSSVAAEEEQQLAELGSTLSSEKQARAQDVVSWRFKACCWAGWRADC